MIEYLIAHKVRGDLGWDIAHMIQIGDETGWVVTSSGHRAYPYRWWQLDDLQDTSDINANGWHNRPCHVDVSSPEWVMLEDHFAEETAPKPDKTMAKKLVDDILALIRPQPAMKVRRL